MRRCGCHPRLSAGMRSDCPQQRRTLFRGHGALDRPHSLSLWVLLYIYTVFFRFSFSTRGSRSLFSAGEPLGPCASCVLGRVSCGVAAGRCLCLTTEYHILCFYMDYYYHFGDRVFSDCLYVYRACVGGCVRRTRDGVRVYKYFSGLL